MKDWLDDHPQGRNPNVFLIPSLDKQHKKFGNRMKESSLNGIYRRYKVEIFPKLLEDPKVVPEDKKKIRELLNKKWHPYVLRHSALTAKSTVLKEHTLRQHAGWTGKSMMHMKYLHYFGNESNESLLAEYGIVTDANKGNVLLPDNLRPKQCPNCSEANIPDSKFCSHCRMILTYSAYEETLLEQKNKDDKLKELDNRMKMYEDATTLQNNMLEFITRALKIDTTSLIQRFDKMPTTTAAIANERDVEPQQQYLDEQLYENQYQQIKRGLELQEQFKDKIMKDALMPEFNNISKNLIKDPKLAAISKKKILSN